MRRKSHKKHILALLVATASLISLSMASTMTSGLYGYGTTLSTNKLIKTYILPAVDKSLGVHSWGF